MRFVLTPVGSSGDVHPFLGIGRELRRRGHDVRLHAAAPFEEAARGAGLEFRAIGTREDYEAVTRDPDLWHPERGLKAAAGAVLRLAPQALQALREEGGECLFVSSTMGLATRCWEELSGARGVTVHLAPSCLRSLHAQPAFRPGRDLGWLPRPLLRAAWWLIDRTFIDPALAPGLNAFRAGLGLAPVQRPFKDWIHSPGGVLGLWPEWFGPAQPDWPAGTTLCGFPLYDEQEQHAPDPALEAFLAAGPPPLALAPGSANRQAGELLRAGVEAAAALGRRIVLLTRYEEQVPRPLPPHAFHQGYAPFSTLLPRCAGLIHHGGIGTSAQALAAGIPQLVTPLSHDQPDNATRLARLGVARWVVGPPRGAALAAALGPLLGDPAVAAAAARRRAETRSGIAAACDRLEALAGAAQAPLR